MKITTYNINGINADCLYIERMKETFPDIVCLQGIKNTSEALPFTGNQYSRTSGDPDDIQKRYTKVPVDHRDYMI